MSTDWGYYCRTCQVESDTWINHGEEALSEFVYIRNIIEASGYDFYWIEVESISSYSGDMREFLDQHKGHDICLASEYGDKKELVEPRKRTDKGSNL